MPTNSKKRPTVPAEFRGVRVVNTGRTFRFRAVADVKGERLVGPLRNDPAAAHQDYLGLCALRGSQRGSPTTVREALERVLVTKMQAGQSSAAWLQVCRRLCHQIQLAWSPQTTIASIDADEITWFVGAMLKRGLSANTLAQKHLPLLRAAFRVAGLVWPAVGVPRLRPVRPAMSFFSLDELRELLARIEAFPFPRGGRSTEADRRQFADVVQLLAFTGCRYGEFGRLRVSDVDLARRAIAITNNKARGRRDVVHYPATIDAAVARLVAAAPGKDGLLCPSPRWLNRSFELWQRRLGEPRLNGRALRHTFVSAVLETSRDLAVTRDAARHASLLMTNRYVHASSEKKRAVVDELAVRLASRTPGS